MAIDEEGAQDRRAGWFPSFDLEILVQHFRGLEFPGSYALYRDCHCQFTSSVRAFLFFLFVYLEDTFFSARGMYRQLCAVSIECI